MNTKTNAARTERPCIGCGRAVAYRTARQYTVNGGKPRVKHNCPHGVPCVFGSFMRGDGCNGPALAGPYHCPQCVAEWKAKRDQKYAPRLDAIEKLLGF